MNLNNVKAAFLTQLLPMAAQVLAFILLNRVLSVEAMGSWSYFLLFFSLAEGLRATFVHNAWIYLSRQTPDVPAETWKAAAWTLLAGITLVLIPLIGVLGWQVEDFLDMPMLSVLCAWYPVLAITSGLYQLTQSEAINELRFKRAGHGALVMSLSLLLMYVGLYALKMDFGLITLLLIQSLSYLLGAWAARLRLPTTRIPWEQVVALYRFGKYSAGTSLGSMLYQKTDALLIGYWLGPTAVGLYSVASRISYYLEIPLNAIAQASFPEMSDKSFTQENLNKSLGLMVASGLPLAIGVLITAPLMIWILAGSNYLAASSCLRIFALMAIIKPFGRIMGLQLEASGRPQLNFRIMWISVGVNLVFNLLFIPYWGIAGATFATLLATGLTIFLSKRLLAQSGGPLLVPAIKNAWYYYQLLFQNLQKSIHHVFSFR